MEELESGGEETTQAGGWLEASAAAKINLGLRIFPRGADGYHPIETIFCRTDFADRLRVRERAEPGVGLRVTGLGSVPAGPDNLAFRAAVLFLGQAECGSGLEIELEKRIPPGAGLGGGSSDAAAVLRLLARRFQLPGGRQALLQMAYELGADVPFFAADVPLAVAAGRGERLLAYPNLEPRPLALLLPDLQIVTSAAYASWDDYSAGLEGRAVPRGSAVPDISSWSDLRRTANDFEPVIFASHPRLRELSAALGATRPLLAQLSGSGSALYGIYESNSEREEAIAKLTGELANVRIVSAYGPV